MKFSFKTLLLALTISIVGCTNIDDSNDNLNNNSITSQEESVDNSIVSNNNSADTNTKKYKKTAYENPVFKEDFPDPSGIYCQEDGYYYLYSTGGKIIRSKDMVNFEKIGVVFDQVPTWGTTNAGFWAPDIVKINGQYIIYYSLSSWGDANPSIGIATATHPAGPWTDKGKLFSSDEIGVKNSIDSATFVDNDGKVYLIWGSFCGIYLIELESDGLSIKGGIEYAKQNKKLIAGLDDNIWNSTTYEGTFIIHENDYYYLFASSGKCCEGIYSSTYHVVVGRSKNIEGPYLDHNSIDMRNENAGKLIVENSDFYKGPGHNCLLQDAKNNWFMYYHSYSLDYRSSRILVMDAIYFDDDKWPYINEEKHVSETKQNKGPYTLKDTINELSN